MRSNEGCREKSLRCKKRSWLWIGCEKYARVNLMWLHESWKCLWLRELGYLSR